VSVSPEARAGEIDTEPQEMQPVQNDSPETKLEACRERIDDVDRRLVALLNERTQVVECVSDIKKSANMPVYSPKREEAVYANIAACNAGPLPNVALQRIFERIIDEMRKFEKERMLGPGVVR
jgi:chorismate mutase